MCGNEGSWCAARLIGWRRTCISQVAADHDESSFPGLARRSRPIPSEASHDLRALARGPFEKDLIKVVAGPGGQLFITDHHHGPEACVVQGVLSVLGSGLLASGCDDPHAPFENDSLG